MKLVQTTLFGVRGGQVRVRKDSPFAAAELGRRGGVATELDPAAGQRERTPRGGVPAGEVKRGGRLRSGAWLIHAALWISVMTVSALIVAVVLRNAGVADASYPDPVCEMCGKVLDGNGNECSEEGNK